MLVISRRKDESLIINSGGFCSSENPVRVTIVDVRPDPAGGYKVRLGVEAPKEVSIHRQEVWEAIYPRQAPIDS
jgi:carbon storage regulator